MTDMNVLQAHFFEKREALYDNFELSSMDYTIVGLTKQTPRKSSKGRKYTATYSTDLEGNNVAVKKDFKDVITSDGRNALEISHNFMNEDGSIDYTKTEVKPLSKVEWGMMLKKRRQNCVIYLQEASKGTRIESHVLALFKHYQDEIFLFEETGSKDWEDAINAETDTTILAYLAIVAGTNAATGDPVDVKTSIFMRISDTIPELLYE